jgi:hypothetical protein
MKFPLALGMVLCSGLTFAATTDYTITILTPDPPAVRPRPEYQAATNLVGKSIAAIFGPVSEVRVELRGLNKTASDQDTKKVAQRIRDRIDRSKCLGRASDVAWHKAPWVHGYILLKDGRILPIEILLSGIVVDDLLFTEPAEPVGPANGSQPIRSETSRTSSAARLRSTACSVSRKTACSLPRAAEL